MATDHVPQYRPEQKVPEYPQQQILIVKAEKNGLGTSSFVLGLLGTIFGLVPIGCFIALPLAIVGLGLGLGNFGRLRKGTATNKAMTVLGVVFSVLGIVLSVIGVVIINNAITSA